MPNEVWAHLPMSWSQERNEAWINLSWDLWKAYLYAFTQIRVAHHNQYWWLMFMTKTLHRGLAQIMILSIGFRWPPISIQSSFILRIHTTRGRILEPSDAEGEIVRNWPFLTIASSSSNEFTTAHLFQPSYIYLNSMPFEPLFSHTSPPIEVSNRSRWGRGLLKSTLQIADFGDPRLIRRHRRTKMTLHTLERIQSECPFIL